MCPDLFLPKCLLIINIALHVAAYHPVCPPGYVSYIQRQKCFRFRSIGTYWDNAARLCHEEGDALVKIPDRDTDTFVSQFHEGYLFFWIGLRGHNEQSNVYTWTDGSSITQYDGFSDGEPSKANALCIGRNRHGWNDRLCYRSYPFLCDRDFVYPVSCPTSWTIDPGKQNCYKVLPSCPDWEKSRSACQEGGGDLATLSDPETKDFVTRLISPNIANEPRYWIGLWNSDNDADHTFEWVDESPLNTNERIVFSNHEGEDYATLHYIEGNYWYTDRPRDVSQFGESYPAICRRDTINPSYPFLQCPNTYTTYTTRNGYSTCVKIVNNKMDTWKGASKDCQSSGGILFTYEESEDDLNENVRKTLTSSHIYWMAYRGEKSMRCPAYINVSTVVNFNYAMGSDKCNGTGLDHEHRYVCQNSGILVTGFNQTEMIPIDREPVTQESVGFLRDVTSPKNNSAPQNNMCPCRCDSKDIDVNPSPEVVAQMLSQIKMKLKVDKTKVSSTRNKKMSAKDTRTGSVAIGYLSVFLCAIPFGCLIAADILRIFQPKKRNNSNSTKNEKKR